MLKSIGVFSGLFHWKNVDYVEQMQNLHIDVHLTRQVHILVQKQRRLYAKYVVRDLLKVLFANLYSY